MRALALALVLSSSIAAAGPRPDAVAADAAREAMATHVPGVAIAIVQDGKTTFAGGFGKAELENDVATTDASVFRINSITKAFTAVLILRLAEAGKLRLEDRLSRYFPQYTRAGFDPTLEQLLTHTGGVASYQGALFHDAIRQDLAPDGWVDALAKQGLYLAAPGTTWSYSNAGYDLLGMIAAKQGGAPYAQLVREQILAPTGMTHTLMCHERGVVPHRASSYAWTGDHYVRPTSWGTYGEASDGLCSTVGDLALFVQALDAGKLVSARSLARMRAAGTLAGHPVDYGFGTRLGHLGGGRMIGYTGSGEEWSSAIVDVPDRRLIVVALANAETQEDGALRIATTIADRLLGIADARLADLDVPPALAGALRGRWQSGGDPPAEISVDGRHLRLQVPGMPQPMRLYFQGGSTFRFGPDSPDPRLDLVFETSHHRLAVAMYHDGLFSKLMVLEQVAHSP